MLAERTGLPSLVLRGWDFSFVCKMQQHAGLEVRGQSSVHWATSRVLSPWVKAHWCTPSIPATRATQATPLKKSKRKKQQNSKRQGKMVNGKRKLVKSKEERVKGKKEKSKRVKEYRSQKVKMFKVLKVMVTLTNITYRARAVAEYAYAARCSGTISDQVSMQFS